MSRIKAIIIALLIVPAAGILAFGPRADESVPSGRVVIDYWEKWPGEEGAQMRQIVDDFNNTVGAEKGIYVRCVTTSQINQKTLVAIAGGVPPDVAGLWEMDLVSFAALDALEPLDELAREHGITRETYKPVYWDACHWDGRLYALISTPATIALHYNKKAFREHASELKAAGLDPERAPRTIDELDRYAKALDEIRPDGRIERLGYLPMEPGWYVIYSYIWFGGEIWDASNERFTLTDPKVVKAFDWLTSYTRRLGRNQINDFRSGVSGGMGNWDSPQNPFLSGAIAMIQQGPWMGNYIQKLKPEMAGVPSNTTDFTSIPLQQRIDRAQWAAAPFPSAIPGLENASYAPFDILAIPKGAKHKREAFEFIAYVNRQDVMEKLCSLHCKNSPLSHVSSGFLEHHKNPYVKVFEDLANSPNARPLPQIPIWREVADELGNAVQRMVLLEAEPIDALRDSQQRLQAKYDDFMAKQRARKGQSR